MTNLPRKAGPCFGYLYSHLHFTEKAFNYTEYYINTFRGVPTTKINKVKILKNK